MVALALALAIGLAGRRLVAREALITTLSFSPHRR